MYNINGNPSLVNIKFSYNSADYGGGIANNNSSPHLSQVSFDHNSATYGGGGMYNVSGSDPVMNNITFTANLASGGGGIYNSNSSPSLSQVTFSENHANSIGGGMHNTSASSPSLTNVTFINNTAGNSAGGMRNSDSNPTINRTTFIHNVATALGSGGMENIASSPTLNNVTFYENSCHDSGGGMSNLDSSHPTLINVTMYGNSAAVGGGGGMANSTSIPTIKNSIIWGNTAPFNPQISSFESTPFITYTDIQGGYAGEGNIDANPLLGPLGTYGGSTLVFALLPGSPAIDSGLDGAGNCAATDQRGINRPMVYHCDMGAFESRGFIMTYVSGDNQTTPVLTAFALPLVVKVTSAFSEPVNDGVVRFSAPLSGPSATGAAPAATIFQEQASMTFTANGSIGQYTIDAHTNGSDNLINYHMTNTFPAGAILIFLPLLLR